MEGIYQLVFCQGYYSHVDFEGTYDQCLEVKYELDAEMRMCGERDFCYIIREK